MFKRKKWKKGIPNYKESDIMTDAELLDFAMKVVMENELDKNSYKIVAATNEVGKIPNFVCEKNGETVFIVVKAAIAPEMPRMTVPEKKNILEHAKQFNAKCYFAAVGFGACDAKRFDASLALRGDAFYSKYVGLEPIEMKQSEDWLKETLEKINALAPQPKPVEESAPKVHHSDKLMYSSKVETDYNIWLGTIKKETFQERLLKLIKERGMTNQEFYEAAFIDRKLFSAIKNNPNYQPKKETAVACCFGLKLEFDEAMELLDMAGFSLSLSLAWDRVIYYCLDKRILDIDVVNELLYEEGAKCIRV